MSRQQIGIICAELVSVGKPERVKGNTYRRLVFKNMNAEDRNEYQLYIIDGYSQSKRFLRLSPGAKLKNVKVYTEKLKFYVDVHSDIQEIKARPLF